MRQFIDVHLKRDINFFKCPLPLIVVVGIDIVGLVAYGEADVVNLVAHALDIPDEVSPSIGGESVAGDVRFAPGKIGVIPDIPDSGRLALEITIRAPNPTNAANTLVDVEFQGLWRGGILEIEVQVIGEVARLIAALDGVELEPVAVSRTADVKVGGLAIHGGGSLIRRQGRSRAGVPGGADLTVAS